MTYYNQKRMTIGELPTFIRDELTSLNGWTVKRQVFSDAEGRDPSNNDYSGEDTTQFHTDDEDNYDPDVDEDFSEHIILSNPDGEYICFAAESANGVAGLKWSYGTTVPPLSDFYSSKVEGYDGGNLRRMAAANNADNNGNYDEAIDVWMSYDSDSWLVYVSREVGDGNDNHMAFGQARVQKLWDYTTAATEESRWVCCQLCDSGGANNDNTRMFNHMAGQNEYSNESGYHPTNTATGAINPDANFEDYVRRDENIVTSQRFIAGDQDHRVPIGTHNRWLWNRSINSMGHMDTVQNSDGNDVYVILKKHSDHSDNQSWELGMRIL